MDEQIRTKPSLPLKNNNQFSNHFFPYNLSAGRHLRMKWFGDDKIGKAAMELLW